MSGRVSLAIVGAGSSYTPELVAGLLRHEERELPVGELRLHDVDAVRLGIMAGLSGRMIAAAGRNLHVRVEPALDAAVAGADFVVTQIRVGGMAGRRLDETIPLKYGIIGQETTGPGGMFKALRTIPVMVEIAREVARLAPAATILNYTNPSGVVTEAVLNHSEARFVGLCSGLPGVEGVLRGYLRPRFGEIETSCVGLNHVGFIHRITAAGEDVTAEAIAEMGRLAAGGPEHFTRWTDLAAFLGAFPMPGYSEYYFRRSAALTKQQGAASTRADQVLEIERELFREAADPALAAAPPALARRGGEGYSSVTFGVLKALLGTTAPQRIVMSARNGDAVEALPREAAVEVVAEVSPGCIRPLPVGAIPLPFRGLVQAVKTHETLTVEAAMTRSRRVALQALVAHPLVGDLEIAEPLLDELLAAHELEYA